jgi:hypothetical protein
VITKATHGFSGGERIRLSTTSALPSGVNTTTDYYVLSTGLTANTFRVSTTFEGAAINTTGTQAGAHSYLQSLWGLGDGTTTFNVPLINDDDRLLAPAGVGRQVGTSRLESIGPHIHAVTGNTGDDAPDHTHSIPLGSSDVDSGTPAGGATTYATTASSGASTRHQHPINLNSQSNSGLVNLPPTIAVLYCVYTGVA